MPCPTWFPGFLRWCPVLGVLLILFSFMPFKADAGGIGLNNSRRVEICACTTAGGDAGTANQGTLLEGSYLFRVTGGDINVCLGTADGGSTLTCPTGGEAFPQGTVMLWNAPRSGQGVSCRSTTDAGCATWTQAQ